MKYWPTNLSRQRGCQITETARQPSNGLETAEAVTARNLEEVFVQAVEGAPFIPTVQTPLRVRAFWLPALQTPQR